MKAKIKLIGEVTFDVETGSSKENVDHWMHSLKDEDVIEILRTSSTLEVLFDGCQIMHIEESDNTIEVI